MIETLEETFNLLITSDLFSIWLHGFIVLNLFIIVSRFIDCIRDGGYTFQKEPDTQEEEITYVNLYDDELLELMAKYDELDKQHKKKKKKKKKQKGEY